MFCANCGHEIVDPNQKFCEKCGTLVGEAGTSGIVTEKKKDKGMAAVTSKINSLAGGEGAVSLHLKDLFSDAFKHHTPEEAEELFICGTNATTPDLKDIVADWPKPWLYSRVGLVLLIAYAIMVFIYKQFFNDNVLPDILFIGSLAMPITVLFLFFEMNVPRNISFIDVIKTFIVGGSMSLVVTLFLFDYIPGSGSGKIIPAMLTGLIEEIGKVLIVAFYISKMNKRKWLLNGIVLGGAVGAGFAVFESAGYALRYGISNGLNVYEYCMQNGYSDYAFGQFYGGFYDGMMEVIKLRAFLSPGGHVAWAAVSGFAILYAISGKEFSWDVLINPKFLRIFIIPVVLHGLWDSSLGQFLPSYTFTILLIVAIWIVLLVFIDRGLHQITEAIISEDEGKEEDLD